MVAITSKIGICNLALGHLGNDGTVDNIDVPTKDHERTFALWYDISRQTLLKLMMPNFSLARKSVAELVTTIPFGYAKAYQIPADCLKVLGLGNIDEKGDFSYSVEGGVIYTDDEWDSGLELRYIKDEKIVTNWSPEFKMTFSLYLAAKTCIAITKDRNKLKDVLAQLPGELAMLTGLNAQENPPIRKSSSRFRAARYSDPSRNAEKK